ncbi:hypothetical protein MF271_04825 [Deinococcus sp. KNUC1210]|uniref:hypothetical protein n=1 Tax=Deinococcus sp. KNUC1210 TaxID=2917691 RepID=UPI001EEFECD2|nr:hypothetical protein [Deinococcus sp. KNUC1210]ULH15958.1 hypothetical protein MF271_04825 [Deinococcus sp. KNUC1210]
MYQAHYDSSALNDHLEALRREAARARLRADAPSLLSRLLALVKRPARPTGTVQHT